MKGELPRWVDLGLLPAVNLLAALALSSLVVLAIGVNPLAALAILVRGAVGYPEAWGYTLYYATNFVFTGLAVAVAFHAGLFNIGGEGQAYVAGLGATLVCLGLDALPGFLVVPLAILAAAAFGAAWGAIPGWLQARRGSHVVITTIMFNFLASALMTYMLSNVLLDPTYGSPETRHFAPHATVWKLTDIAARFGFEAPRSPLNAATLLALAAAAFVWVYVWRTRAGYALRTVGANEQAARYAGIDPARTIIAAMAISGALAGLMAVNEVMGSQQRMVLAFTGGYGFVGIAVALMGRNHPVGVCLAALLFGALYQGGSDLAFEISTINRDLVIVIQGLVILFCGALENMFRPALAAFFARERAAA
ncbi:MAG: ABC transporter permease [Alphaproteobacteria bacterium]|nr:ABC transporter permease [Alphaproteobacteria bacterium]